MSQSSDIIIIDPLLVSNHVKTQLRKTKIDKKDAVVIALFLLANGNTHLRPTKAPLLIIVKAFAYLPAKPPCSDHLYKKQRWSILWIFRFLVETLCNR